LIYMSNPIRVLIVDDSATARILLKETLENSKDIEVIGTAQDAYVARDMIVKLNPDVICLDVEMPRMDGITFLKKLMKHFPKPVVMVSSLTQKGAQTTLEALDAGAVDFVGKPDSSLFDGIEDIENDLIAKIKMAAKANVTYKQPTATTTRHSLAETTDKIVAIGASTGGTTALRDLLSTLPRTFPGIIVVQHMPENYTKSFAKRLNECCEMDIKEAEDGDYVGVGQVLIAPGAYHMVLRRDGAKYRVKIGTGDKVSGHRPSVDVMFNSVAKYAGSNALGVILTGMGGDGAKGLLNMKKAGATTIAQDERSCVVFGMPKVAIDMGGVDKIESLENIPNTLINILNNK
jgi:two-component system chemotaxis response regulator CheB